MAITSLKQLRETAPPEFQNLDARELVARYSQSAGVPFEQAASYFGVPARGLVREMLTQAAGSAMVDMPRMVGQAAEYLGAEEFGQSLQEGARAREAAYAPDIRGRNVVGEALVLGSRAVAPVAATLPLGLVPGGQFVAPAAAAGLFGLSSAQETYDKLIAQGRSPEEAAAAARGTGLIQGVGEAAATYAGARLLKPAMAAVRGAPTTARIAAEATETGVTRPFLRGMGINLATQPTTEVAQDVGTAMVEEAYGAKPEDKWEIARQSALGGAGLTLLLGPLALGGSIQRSRNAARLKEALDPQSGVDPTFRYAAMDRIMEEARRQGVAESDVGSWLDTQLQAEDSLTAELQAQEQEAFRQRVLQRIEAGEPPEMAEASTAQEAQNPEFWRAFEQRVGIAPEGPAPVGLRREQAEEGFDLLQGPRIPGITEVMPGVYLETPEQPAPQAQPIDLTQPTTTTISQAQLAEEEGGMAPEIMAAQPSAISVSGVNAPTLPVPPMQAQLAEEELPAPTAPVTIAPQPPAQAAASLPGREAGLPPATPAGGLSTEQKPAAPTPPATPEAPAKDTLTAEERAKLAQDLSNLEATITSTPGAVQGKLTLPQSVLAGLARMVRTDKVMPGIAYVPKTASEVDTPATQQYGEQMGKIRDAANKVIDAARTLFNFEANLPPTPSKSAIQKKDTRALTDAEKDIVAMSEAGVEVAKLAQQRLALRNAIEELRAATGSDVNTEAVVAVAKTAIQRAQQKSQSAAKAKMETSRDTLLSRAWAMYKDGALQTPEQVDVVRGRETRLSTEAAARGAEEQPLVKAATEGYARRVAKEPVRKKGESDADFEKRKQRFEAMKEKGVSGILAYMQRHGTGFERLLASAIGRALRNPKRPAPTLQWIPAGEKSYYDPKTNTVALHETESPEVILHEALHAALQWYVYQNPAAAEVVQLEAALKRVLDYKGAVPPTAQAVIDTLRAKYGDGKTKEAKLDAILELISYGTTLNEFRNLLKTMPSVQTPENAGFFAGVKVLWKRITALVQKALGVENTLANDILDSSVALLEQASEETNVPAVAQGARLEAAVQSNKATREAAGMTAQDYRTYQKRLAPGVLSTKIAFDAIGWNKAAAFAEQKLAELAKLIRKDLPMVERALIYIDSTFSATPRGKEYIQQTKFDRNVGYQQMEELAKHFERVDVDGQTAVLSYLDGDKKALRGRDDEAYLRSIADDVRKWLDTYIDALPESERRFFRTGKFSETLLFPATTSQVASSTFGVHKLSELMGTKRRGHDTIDSFREWMKKPDGAIDADGRFYEVTQHSDLTKGPIHAGYISVENYAQNGAPKGFSVDTKHKWWISGFSGESYKFATSMTAKEAIKEQKTEEVANALRNTMAALANNYAAQNFSNAISRLGYGEDGKPTAESVAFDSLDAINETFGVKVDPKTVLSVSSDEARSGMLRAEYRRSGTWVKLPASANYGELSGKYIHGPVWTAMIDATDRQPLVQLRAYNNTMRWFKKSKTVYNPATHLTNVASNVTLAMLHDIPMRTMGKAAALFAKYAANPASLTSTELELMSAFRNSGAMLGDFSSSEVKQALYDAWKSNMDADSDSSLIRRLKSFTKYEQLKSMGLSKLIEKGKAGAEVADRIASEAYAAEDNIFRLAAFLTKAGDLQVMRGESAASEQTILDAGKFAKTAFLDYDIDSKAVKVLRQSVMPFISWTYAITPVLGRIAMYQPWKLANVMLAYYLIERGLASMSGDDDEEARAGGPEFVRDRMWGFGPYMHMRIPFLGDDENPVYYRIGDYFPMATMFKSLPNGPAGQSWIPSSLTPSGPFVSAIVGLVAGVDPYTGKGIHEATDTDLQKLWNATKFMYDVAVPPAVNSRNIERATAYVNGDTGITGALPSGYQFARMAGLKLYDYNIPEEQARQELAVKRIERDFKTAISKAKREEMRSGNPDWEALDEEVAELERRMEEEVAAARGGELE